MAIWHDTVQDYTRRNITKPEDIFPAIGGVAEYIAQIVGRQKYAAGLWENNLLFDLMWTARGKEWLFRPNEWRAPTWSWAGVNGPVSYVNLGPQVIPPAEARLLNRNSSLHETDQIRPSDFMLQISGYLTRLMDDEARKLFDDQWVIPALSEEKTVKDHNSHLLEHISLELGSGFPIRSLGEQTASRARRLVEQSLPEQIFAMPLFSQTGSIPNEKQYGISRYSGLIFSKVDNVGYERIGSFVQQARPWFDEKDEKWRSGFHMRNIRPWLDMNDRRWRKESIIVQ